MNEVECLKVARLEDVMLDLPQDYCPVTHTFSNGVYVREVFMPKDALVVGHFHSTPQLNIMISGVLEMIDGDNKEILVAPMMFTGKEGRKVARIIEDCVWLNVYGTSEQDIDTLERTYMIKSPIFMEKTKLLQNDYEKCINKFGFDEETVRCISENEEVLCPLPYGSYKFKIGNSNIEGRGVLATASINTGEFIGMCRINENSTVLGRYLNHSEYPNTQMIKVENDIGLVAIADIDGSFGGLDGTELTVNYADVLKIQGLNEL